MSGGGNSGFGAMGGGLEAVAGRVLGVGGVRGLGRELGRSFGARGWPWLWGGGGLAFAGDRGLGPWLTPGGCPRKMRAPCGCLVPGTWRWKGSSAG